MFGTYDTYIYAVGIFILILGLAIGSFLGVLIDRLPLNETLGGRSHCDICKKVLRGIDMIPVISFVIMKGRSTCCQKPLTWFYPTIEILTAAIFLAIFVWLGMDVSVGGLLSLVIYCAIAACFIVILFADIKYHIIPDEMNVVLIFLGFLLHPDLQQILLNGVAGLGLAGALFLLFVVTKGKGLGFGDVKFAFVMGFLLGIFNGFIALYIAFIAGGAVSTILLLTKKSKPKTKIAFGPFLIFGTVCMLFFGEKIASIFKDLFV